ncbi:MAG: glycosyltransferase family 39 protein [Deltaproteobacteria bacterium]|nr:glycosyltransferase family 39 protein [Deltaproteobacteria bacterium]
MKQAPLAGGSAQPIAGGILAAVGILGMAFLMARDGHTVWGVGVGMLLDAVAALGLVGLLCMFRTPAGVDQRAGVEPQAAGSPYRDAPMGAGPATGPSTIRPEAVVLLVGAIVMIPGLTFGLWDPWETHYGEVSREILCRDDWISLWWQDEWFWSKPIGLFWMSAISLAVLGVDYHPDGGAGGHQSHAMLPVGFFLGAIAWLALWSALRVWRRDGLKAGLWRAAWVLSLLGLLLRELVVAQATGRMLELALRLPVVLSALAALWVLAWSVHRVFGQRAALLSGITLATMPHFFFLSHQAMVDMPFVAGLTVAVCLLMAAWTVPDHELAPAREVRIGRLTVELSLAHAVVFALIVVALPQIVYLATRHLTIGDGLSFHADRFWSGSAENGTMRQQGPFVPALPPLLQAVIFAAPLAFALVWSSRERRMRPVLMLAFYGFGALSLMSKGLPGVLLPGLIALGALVVSGRWKILGELRILSGAAIVASVGLPWYVAMFTRHGPRFTDRLLIHDHINRLAVGVHGDTGSVQYFIAQLGYATFPWCALALVGLAAILMGRVERQTDRDEAHRLVFLWFALSFALFSVMVTKFHHYIFPAVPPLAILIGIFLDRFLDTTASEPPPVAPLAYRVAWVLAVPALVLVPVWALATRAEPLWDPVRDLPVLRWLGPGWLAVVACAAIGWWLAGRARVIQPREEDPWLRSSLGAALLGGVAVVALVGRDLADTASTGRPKGYERLIDLYVYNYTRAWPQGAEYDFSPALGAFAIVGMLVVLLLVSSRLRKVGVHALVALAFGFSLWAQHVYMHRLTPHWSQRHLIDTYYAKRRSRDERLVAWQMNWKGENLYTGGRAVIYVSLDNADFERWIGRHRGQTHYFILERGRLANLRRVLGKDEGSSPVVDDTCNKFVLVRARL